MCHNLFLNKFSGLNCCDVAVVNFEQISLIFHRRLRTSKCQPGNHTSSNTI